VNSSTLQLSLTTPTCQFDKSAEATTSLTPGETLQALEIAFFKLYRRQLIVETMQAFWGVEHLDVIEHISASILPGAVDLSPDPLSL
jgi:hypothetical protein